MARNKQTPLKDESEYSVDDLYQKLDEVLKAINNRNLEEAKKLWNLGDTDMAKYALSLIDFNKAVATAIEAYLKQHQNRFVVEGKQDIPEDVMTLLEQYRQELAEAKEKPATPAVTVIDRNIVEAAVTTVIGKGHTNATFITKPERPTSLKGVPGYLFFLLPWYYVRRFFADRYVKWWFRIVMFCVWLTSIFLTCIIAHDNARLNTIEKKYVLLREFARPNKEWAEKADYIEFLYTDEAEHQEELHRLWKNRRKRIEQRVTR
ncbi:MAG: hypothetical protein J5637_01815 [Prevotella sp.]|nr:hypothetical protein [Prevotella sp.]